jgi:DNA recombination protein RmuC
MIITLLAILITLAIAILLRLPKNDKLMQEEFERNREESRRGAREDREELQNSFSRLSETIQQNLKTFEERVDGQMKGLREENTKSLDQMRKTVDENLKETVEKRFNESFTMISERLEKVHQGLGEMQQLASGVGDLKRVLTNVKTKGILGEIQLENILEQILSAEQYESQVSVKRNSQERVDFVVKLPDKNSKDKNLLLPIDSKFPTEDFIRLADAYEAALPEEELKRASSEFERAVKKSARDIRDKYINPPATTDFAIMFVPTESLYAEIVRRPALFEHLQKEYKVTVVGPTNLAAFLNSLQMGFRTLAIERRSNEVWKVLLETKKEFSKFRDIIDKIHDRLKSAMKDVDTFGVRSRQIERRLKDVEELPEGNALEVSED